MSIHTKKNLIHDNYIFLLVSNLPWNWCADYVKQTANQLSKDNKVFVLLWHDAVSLKEIIKKHKKINLFKKVKDNLSLYIPIHFVPFRRFKCIQKINYLINVLVLKTILNFSNFRKSKKVLWIFSPEFYSLPKIMGKFWFSIYDCVEYISSFKKELDNEIRNKEINLIKNVALFVVDSLTLKKVWGKYNPTVVPQGFDFDTFEKYKKRILKREIELPRSKPIVGYIGGINYRLDFQLINDLVNENPQWNFVFIGPIQRSLSEDIYTNTQTWLKKLKKYHNFYIFKYYPKRYIPQIIEKFDVCIIPYNVKIKFNLYSRSMKTYEYLFFGKPIISTPILESIRLNKYVIVKKDSKGFSKSINNVLKGSWPKNVLSNQVKFVKNNSWENKITKILSLFK